MIRRVIDLAGQPMPTDEAISDKADAWAGAMFGIIPEDRLMDAFNQAIRYHDTVYPVNAHEILMAWKEVAESESKIAEKRRTEVIRDRALEAPEYEDCPKCHGCGFKPAMPRNGYAGVERCYECSYWLKRDAARREAQASSHKIKRGGAE